jgi:hypothetical protein
LFVYCITHEIGDNDSKNVICLSVV